MNTANRNIPTMTWLGNVESLTAFLTKEALDRLKTVNKVEARAINDLPIHVWSTVSDNVVIWTRAELPEDVVRVLGLKPLTKMTINPIPRLNASSPGLKLVNPINHPVPSR
ncbi:hypothetical protein Peetri_00170 [Pseudomonas phage vB_PpuM-Peetri]